MVDHQVLGRGTTFQYELGSYVHYVHRDRCDDLEIGGGGVLGAYHIEVVHPCMDLLEIHRLQSRH
jgi:hypothetical protein